MKSYRTAFLGALAVNGILLAIVAGWWWSSRTTMSAAAAAQQSSGAVESAATSTPSAEVQEQAEPALAPLQISSQRLQSIGVKISEVQRKAVDDRIATTGNVVVDETKLAYVQVRFSGYVQKVFVDATYQYVRKGQPLFTIYSPDLVSTERELLLARENQRQLSHSPDPDSAADAASLVGAAAQRLRQWDVPQREIARIESTGQVRQDLEIDSPVSGYITEREALPNKYAQPDTRLYTVADLSTIWVFAQVFQNDLGRLKVGDSAELTVDTYPGRTFPGRVNFIYPDIDMTTRTARVRLAFANPALALKPGMFVNVSLDIPLGEHEVIPAAGVLQTGTRSLVFVDHGGGNLEPRDIELGERAGDDYIVLKGLKAGERIVTSANFLIDSESQLQAALGTFVPPPPGAGDTGATGVPQASIELTTEPTPPRKGANLIRVKLTDEHGAAVSDAQVTVTFNMAAMPAMGMAAMRVPVSLAAKGNGLFEGSAELQSGGTWQVTILAKENDQVLASKRLSVNATGGM
jgi:RND family efflux transporter MFP subunit